MSHHNHSFQADAVLPPGYLSTERTMDAELDLEEKLIKAIGNVRDVFASLPTFKTNDLNLRNLTPDHVIMRINGVSDDLKFIMQQGIHIIYAENGRNIQQASLTPRIG